MKGFILNEVEVDEGYVTFPYDVFKHIEHYVKSLNWRISNVECDFIYGADFKFPFEHTDDYFIDGDTLFSMLKEHSEKQWIWGILSGFPKEIPWEEIKKNPVIDATMESPYLENTLHHIEPMAVFEMIAWDSSETHILVDDDSIADCLLKVFTKAESLEKYVSEEQN